MFAAALTARSRSIAHGRQAKRRKPCETAAKLLVKKLLYGRQGRLATLAATSRPDSAGRAASPGRPGAQTA